MKTPILGFGGMPKIRFCGLYLKINNMDDPSVAAARSLNIFKNQKPNTPYIIKYNKTRQRR